MSGFQKYKECPECSGTGRVECEVAVADFGAWRGGELRLVSVDCENCDGTGSVVDDGIDDENWEDFDPMVAAHGY